MKFFSHKNDFNSLNVWFPDLVSFWRFLNLYNFHSFFIHIKVCNIPRIDYRLLKNQYLLTHNDKSLYFHLYFSKVIFFFQFVHFADSVNFRVAGDFSNHIGRY